ncbi:alpha-glucosidase/alpha-galactosidase [Paenibacillus sp. FSL H8-0548]|uniref:family 4 glycosyl hydrolase n=1 Tax=Paenibacillus sp. FSL H8-0548 TaxID=1920422 RepID=UPI00096DED05|nr:alpha-glucosidase/alpha-galactosidase [Paenibacillus sp. FSL H8-0548]OMF21091.1 alpha-glucosidase/alpha-galactosidase [Paenibacillus sp. FSL H8-0548]
MNTNEKRKENVQIAYIGGGSRGWAWGLMSDLAAESELAGTVKLYDIHYESAAQNAIIGNRLSQAADTQGKWSYEAVPALQDALQGADFIIISILPGTFAEMESDVHLPEEYGIYQSVGDTVGPGGLVRALRTIPLYVDIANAIKQYAPDAWVINYTNPMTLCTRTLYEVFPEVKAIGCCHEVFGTQHLLASMVESKLGVASVDRREIKVNVLGINHFTWLDRASYQGIDLFPLYQEFVEEQYAEGYEGKKKGHWLNDHFASAQRVKFDLFRKYGMIAAAGDRHLAEFMPGELYLKDPETVQSWKFSLTKVDWRKKNQTELYAKGQRLAAGEEAFVVKPTGEEGIEMIKALLGMGGLITNVNMPNRGQIEGLPAGAVVETNAVFSYNHVSPILAGKLTPEVEQLVLPHVTNQEMTLQAALNKDKALAFQAFMNDPLVRLPEQAGAALFGKMLQNTKSMLPGWEL